MAGESILVNAIFTKCRIVIGVSSIIGIYLILPDIPCSVLLSLPVVTRLVIGLSSTNSEQLSTLTCHIEEFIEFISLHST